MPAFTDFDWTTTRERNLKKTKKDTRREFDIDIDGLPQESNGGYDMVGKQGPSDKMIISPTANNSRRMSMIPKWLEKAVGVFAGNTFGKEKIVTASASANAKVVDSFLDQHRVKLNSVVYSRLIAKAEAVEDIDFNKISNLVNEVKSEIIKEAMTKSKDDKRPGVYDYKFTTVIGKHQNSQVKTASSKDYTLAELISNVAAKMKTEITSDQVQDITKQVQQEIGKKRHASNEDINKLVYNSVEIIKYKKIGGDLKHDGIRTTVEQINLENKREARIQESLMGKASAYKASTDMLNIAKVHVKEAAERMSFPEQQISVQKQERMPEGYTKKDFDEGKEKSTPATSEAAGLFQKIIDVFSVIKRIEAEVDTMVEDIKKAKGLTREIKKLEEATVKLATLAGIADNNIIQLKDKAEAAYNYAVLVTHEKIREQPTTEEIEAEMKKKLPFFDFNQYEDVRKKLEETIAALKATKIQKLVPKKSPELKIITNSLSIATESLSGLINAIEAINKVLEQFNVLAENTLAEAEEIPAEEATPEALPVAASVNPNFVKKAGKEPGKFEGEPDYVEYFYEIILDGSLMGEEFDFGEGEVYTLIILTKEDKQKFPEIADIYGICLTNSTSGFVGHIKYDTKEEYDSELANLEEQIEKFNAETEGDEDDSQAFGNPKSGSKRQTNNEVAVGDTIKIDMNTVKQYSTHPNHLSLVRKVLKNGEGTVYVSAINAENGTIDVRAWKMDLIGDVTIPKEAVVEVVKTASALHIKHNASNEALLRTAGFPDRYPYVDKCRNCTFFWSGLGTVYDKCVDCIHFYSEPELKDMAKEDVSGLGDYFNDKGNRYNVGTPTFQQKHS
jgi:hypothetical protein